MPRGAQPGERRGGRAAGTPNKRTKALAEAAQRAAQTLAEHLGPHCFPGDAHAMLMAVYKDTRLPIELREDAAKAAIGFEKPRRLSNEHKGSVNVRGGLDFLLDDDGADTGLENGRTRGTA